MDIANMVEELKKILQTFEKVYVLQEYKEAKSISDWMTKKVVKRDKLARWTTGDGIFLDWKRMIEKERI